MTELDIGIDGITDASIVGVGGNATVYRARETAFDRDVAVKILRPSSEDRDRVRFDRERKAMGRAAGHPNIVDVYSSGYTRSGQPYIVMPYYERGSLADELQAGPLELGRARDVLASLASGLGHAHDLGIVHRDMKPGNVLLDAERRPVITDFGIAKLGAEMSTTAVTMTPLYSAPEIFEGAPPTIGSDVYSLGAIGYAVFAGRPAFGDEDTSIMAVMRRVSDQEVPPLPQHVPPQVEAVVRRAMAKRPEARFGSAVEFRTALLQAFESPVPAATLQRPVQPSGDAAGSRLPAASATATASPAQPVERRRGAFLAAVLALLVLAGGLAALLLNQSGDDPPADQELVTSADPTPEPTAAPTAADVTVALPSTLAAAMEQHDAMSLRVESFGCRQMHAANGVRISTSLALLPAVVEGDWYGRVLSGGEWFDLRTPVGDVAGTSFTVGVVDWGQGSGPALADPETVAGRSLPLVSAVNASTGEETVVRLNAQDNGEVMASDGPLDSLLWDDAGAFVGVIGDDGVVVAASGIVDAVEGASLFTPVRNRTCPIEDAQLPRRSVPVEVTSADEAVASLLLAQRLATALASQDWDTVRAIEPVRQTYTDAQLDAGWGALAQSTLVPIEFTTDSTGPAWRLGLVGHELHEGDEITVAFCVTWRVDAATQEIEQTTLNPVVLADQFSPIIGWALASDFVEQFRDWCPVEDNPISVIDAFVRSVNVGSFQTAASYGAEQCESLDPGVIEREFADVGLRFRVVSMAPAQTQGGDALTLMIELRLDGGDVVRTYAPTMVRDASSGEWRFCGYL